MDFESVLTLAVGLLLAFRLDKLADWVTDKVEEKYFYNKCEMCAAKADGEFHANGKQIHLCHDCFSESMQGTVKEAIMRARDEFESEQDF